MLQPIVLLCAVSVVAATAPQVQLGGTTVVGAEFTLAKVEFFGGELPRQ